MKNNPLPRLDLSAEIREQLLPFCRLKPGDIWHDELSGHRVGCLDAANSAEIEQLMAGEQAQLAIQDPPYNLVAFAELELTDYIKWCQRWVENSWQSLGADSSFYVWLGADQRNHFQPLPDFMIMMRQTEFVPRSFVSMRNQRGYGTQKNWMAIRQELLYYMKGSPEFNVQYTDIPKVVRGYYKKVNGSRQENVARSRSENIRAGNVWIDVQQVFYRMEENVSGCYAQKPLKSAERIVKASSQPGDLVLDFFSHAGTTLLGCEKNARRCFTTDNDPIFCEISIRRIEHWRKTGRTGWQNSHPFEAELPNFAPADDHISA